MDKQTLEAALKAAKQDRDDFYTNTLKKEGNDVGKIKKLIRSKKADIADTRKLVTFKENELEDLYAAEDKEVDEINQYKLVEAEKIAAIKAIENLIV